MSLHASFSYRDAKELFFTNNVIKHKTQNTYISERHMHKLGVFVSWQDEFTFFFHHNHTIYHIAWPNTWEKTQKAKCFHDIRQWHCFNFPNTLDIQLYDAIDIEAWFDI